MKRIINKVSKMPCYSFNHGTCITGNKLRKISGSVCSECYACKGFYVFHKEKHAKKTLLLNDLNKFKEDLINDIKENCKKEKYFRYHDKGDIINAEHLKAIVEIAKALPDINFWLPTKEYKIVRDYIKEGNAIPDNLTVRLSKYMKNKDKKLDKILNQLPYSTVYEKHYEIPDNAYLCNPIDGKCNDCRACWDKKVINITYIKH